MVFRNGKGYTMLKAGDRWSSGGVTFEVLWPRRLTGNFNRDSIVIKASYGNCSFLFMGDADRVVEKSLVMIYGDALRSTVLKVGHHGAKDATSREFLRVVSPRYAVISVDKGNIRGYPSKDVVEHLKSFGVKTFVTFRDGDIGFFCDGGRLWIKVRKKSR